jgi:glycosyltransferase involved in cell wall biosynthesis
VFNDPLVSIIIPTFNRGQIISETLASVENQIYKNWECIVIDDGSEDNTQELLNFFSQKDKRFKFFKRNRTTKGAPTCRNIGIEFSKGEFLYFFDSDDIMYPELLVTFISEFKKEEVIDFCCCEADYFDFDKIVRTTNHALIPHSIEGHLKNYGFMAPSFFIKKSLLVDIGFWDETILRLQDVDYFSRLFSHQKKGKWINKSLFKKRLHSHNISSMWSKEICISIIKVHKKIDILFKPNNSKELNEIIGRRITAFSISALASGFWIVAFKNFGRGFFLLPVRIKILRLKEFVLWVIRKPFTKNCDNILLHY